ncbi:MAG: hypothetical protein ACXVDN_14575 [Ktedonobacteraceae bacterium]
MSAALEQMGIKLSRATCGRYLSINRSLYHLQMPRKPRPKAEMPFRAERRHQLWSVDIRYLDMHSLKGVEMVWMERITMRWFSGQKSTDLPKS